MRPPAPAIGPSPEQRLRFARAHPGDGFGNLEVLPAAISRHDLERTMSRFAAALGVRCSHCHVGRGRKRDFAADDKPAKETARAMMRLTARVNDAVQRAVGSTARDTAAIEILRLNLANFPESTFTLVQLGSLLQRTGARREARMRLEEALRLDPDNRWVRRRLQEVLGADAPTVPRR